MALGDLSPMTTTRLGLRPLASDDSEVFRLMTDEPAITEVVHFLPSPFTLADAQRLLAGQGDGRDIFWGLWPHDEPALAGTVGTHLVGERELEIGYWLATAWRGRGFASEALATLLPVLAQTFPRRRIFAECRPENAASWRLLVRAGFTPDGSDGKRDGRKRLVFVGARDAGRA